MEPYDYYIEFFTPDGIYGSAINSCWEEENGEMWVSNGEYSSQVNFCPITGRKATKQIPLTDSRIKINPSL